MSGRKPAEIWEVTAQGVVGVSEELMAGVVGMTSEDGEGAVDLLGRRRGGRGRGVRVMRPKERTAVARGAGGF